MEKTGERERDRGEKARKRKKEGKRKRTRTRKRTREKERKKTRERKREREKETWGSAEGSARPTSSLATDLNSQNVSALVHVLYQSHYIELV